ncbi:MAG: bifunctional DNA-formamidopyrimidine glycosylase/DNA-(apurinic or apyrimidinic site) lyase [Candidatus Hodarchaeales archaeon]
MPEGPEVELVRQDLLFLENQRLLKISLTPLALKYSRYQEQAEKIHVLTNKKLKQIERRGKFLIWWFGTFIILNHLGMTGNWILNEEKIKASKHAKIILEFENGKKAVFDDMRNFGRFQVYESEEALLKQVKSVRTLGIDGLADVFPQEEFETLLALPRNQNKPLGEILLDQRLVSGIGNIYKSEILFTSKLHPLVIVSSLSKKEQKQLGESISIILKRALNSGGSTIENYQAPSGEGKAQQWHQVYAKTDLTCSNCQKTPVERLVQKQRSTFYCPKCQAPNKSHIMSPSIINKREESSKQKRKRKKKR